jgi:hypothetical protein
MYVRMYERTYERMYARIHVYIKGKRSLYRSIIGPEGSRSLRLPVARLSAIRTGRLYITGTQLCYWLGRPVGLSQWQIATVSIRICCTYTAYVLVDNGQLPSSDTLIEVLGSSKTLVAVYKTARCLIPKTVFLKLPTLTAASATCTNKTLRTAFRFSFTSAKPAWYKLQRVPCAVSHVPCAIRSHKQKHFARNAVTPVANWFFDLFTVKYLAVLWSCWRH